MAESSNNEEKMNHEKLRNNLRKMIKSFDNYIKEAKDFEQLEDNLKHMEETDENFHKYDLVEVLSDKIDTHLGDSIDKHVNETFNSNKFDGDIAIQNKMAQNICDDIMKTKEFTEFKNSFKSSVLKANDFLVKNFHNNFIESNSEEITIHENESKSIAFTNDFEFSSPDNSLNQNSFVFFTSEQFPVIAQNLDPKKPDQVRLRAIQQLLSIPASDPQAADHWVEIRKHLNLTFKDPSENISDLCIKLHSRTLASSHYRVSLEIYINLVEHLHEYFKDKELEKRSLKTTFDISTTENNFLLRIFRLINDYAKDIPNKWARYPESFIESIIEETLKLCTLLNEPKYNNYTSPLHYISLLDMQSNWFAKWMHGHDSRKVLINSIKKYEAFLQTSVNSLSLYLNTNARRTETNQSLSVGSSLNGRKKSNSFVAPSNGSKRTIFRKVEIEYAHFVHSLNVIRKILCFKNGRRLFPIKISNREVGIKDLIKTIIQIIFETASFKTASEYSPSKYAYDLLQDLCVAEDTCEACLCNEEVIEQLIKPLKTIMQSKKNNQLSSSSNFSMGSSSNNTFIDESCMLIIANVLSKLASTECGYRQLIYNDSKKNFSTSPIKSSAAHTIVSFVKKALTNQLNYNISTSEIAEYLYLSRLLYSQCQGIFLVREYELNKCISESWRISDKEKPSSTPNTPRQASNFSITVKETFTFSWSESLLDNLLSMASTPKGVFYLNESGLINQVVNYMFSRYKSKLQVGKYEKFGYGFIISQLANTASGCYYLNESSLIQYLTDEIWTELEYGSDDFMSAFPRSYSVEPIDREVYKPLVCLINILSSFSAVYELLADVTVTPRSFYGIRDVPKGLIGLLDRVAFLDKKAKISSLCNYEQSHTFGLRLLSFLQSDLDVLLLIESQYSSTNLLLNLQRSNRPIKANYDFNNEEAEMSKDTNEDDEENFDQLKNPQDQKLEIMIDMLSVERNFVLVNSNVIGGSKEKLLPNRNLLENKKFVYNHPLFDSLPVPNSYIKKNDLTKYPKDDSLVEYVTKFSYEQVIKSEDSTSKWLKKFKSLYASSLKSSRLSLETMPTALSQIVQIYLRNDSGSLIGSAEFKNFNEFMSKCGNSVSGTDLSNLQKLGVEKSIEYGIQIGLLEKNTKEEHTKNLIDVHKLIKTLLKSSNKSSKKPSPQQKQENVLNYSQEDSYPSYDWFSSTVFLMNKGDLNSTIKFLYNFHNLQVSSFLWYVRLFSNDTLLSNVYIKNGISILMSTTCHYIEHILKIELPLIFSAFRMSGLAPSQICSHWLKQCFWNYLDWPDIVTYLSVCIIFGVDYQTYFCISLLKHLNQTFESNNLNQKIIQHHTYRDLQAYLKENQIENFKIEQHMDYMFELEQKYRQYIFDDIKETLNKV